MELKDIQKLANLARIEVSDEEADKFKSDLDGILKYVDQIESAPVSESGEAMLINVMREDENAHESGVYSPELVSEFPEKDGDFMKVKKIL